VKILHCDTHENIFIVLNLPLIWMTLIRNILTRRGITNFHSLITLMMYKNDVLGQHQYHKFCDMMGFCSVNEIIEGILWNVRRALSLNITENAWRSTIKLCPEIHMCAKSCNWILPFLLALIHTANSIKKLILPSQTCFTSC